MNRKAFTVLIVIACAFVVLAIIGRNRTGTETSIGGDSAGTLLLPALANDLDDIDEVTVDGAGRQRLVSLERADDGWTVTELGGYPAERSKVNALVIALAEARIVEEKTSNPEFYSRLGVEAVDADDAAGLEIALVGAGGARYDIVLGDTYTGSQRYARIADRDLSVQIDRDPDAARDPSDWVAKEILDVAANRVQRVEISHADGERLVLRKAAPGDTDFAVDDIPQGRELQYAGVANVTGSLLQGLRLDDVRRRDDAAEAPEPDSVTEFFTFDGLVVTVAAAPAEEDEAAWLSFSARFDAEQALDFATGTVGDIGAEPSDQPDTPAADAAEAAEAADAADPEPGADAMAEAESINARLADWQYRIPSYQLSQLTRRMDDLLQPEADE